MRKTVKIYDKTVIQFKKKYKMLKNIDAKLQKKRLKQQDNNKTEQYNNIKVEIRRWESYNKIIKNRKTNF